MNKSHQLTLATCSFETPDITMTMLKSFHHFHPDNPNILISENSYYPSTREKLTDFGLSRKNVHTSFNRDHIKTVDFLINGCATRYMLLVDTDIVFLRNCDDLLDMMGDAVILGKVTGDRGGKKIHERVDPWFCLMDVAWIYEKGIRYYDSRRYWEPGSKWNKYEDKRYDVGSSLLEDIRKAEFKVKDVDLEGTYFRHYEGMSWQRDSDDPVLRAHYRRMLELHEIDRQRYEDVEWKFKNK